MQRYFILIILFSIAFCAYAKKHSFFFIHQDQVQIYPDSVSSEPFCVVCDNNELELWADIEILGKSQHRFYVIVCYHTNITYLRGWIDKENCGVYLLSRNANYEMPFDDIEYTLYQEAGDGLPSIKIKNKELRTHLVHVLDYKDEFIKVRCYKKDGNIIDGWVSYYCGFVNGCEGIY